jgi:hypothetical protein
MNARKRPPRWMVRLSVARSGDWRSWGIISGTFERALAEQASRSVHVPHIESENRRGLWGFQNLDPALLTAALSPDPPCSSEPGQRLPAREYGCAGCLLAARIADCDDTAAVSDVRPPDRQLALLARSSAAKDAELLVLRHEAPTAPEAGTRLGRPCRARRPGTAAATNATGGPTPDGHVAPLAPAAGQPARTAGVQDRCRRL